MALHLFESDSEDSNNEEIEEQINQLESDNDMQGENFDPDQLSVESDSSDDSGPEPEEVQADLVAPSGKVWSGRAPQQTRAQPANIVRRQQGLTAPSRLIQTMKEAFFLVFTA
jgi:hypothetical protein